MAFKKYEPRSGGGKPNHLAVSRFPLCWIGRSGANAPANMTFNSAALALFGDGTSHVEIMWDGEQRMFAFVPSPRISPDAMKLGSSAKETSGVRRIGLTGLVKAFPEIASLGGRVWRILPDLDEGYYVARLASQKELTDGL